MREIINTPINPPISSASESGEVATGFNTEKKENINAIATRVLLLNNFDVCHSIVLILSHLIKTYFSWFPDLKYLFSYFLILS